MAFLFKNLPNRMLARSIIILNKTPLIDVKREFQTRLEREWIKQNNIKIKESIKGNLSFNKNKLF
jgi:hypothetical protein